MHFTELQSASKDSQVDKGSLTIMYAQKSASTEESEAGALKQVENKLLLTEKKESHVFIET